MAPFHIKQPGKSGHFDNLDTFCWSQGVNTTQVPLYLQELIKAYKYEELYHC